MTTPAHPNLCDDMHWKDTCPESQSAAVATGDAWLKTFLPSILGSSDYASGKTLVVITWDEGSEGSEGSNKGIDCLTAPNSDSVGCLSASWP